MDGGARTDQLKAMTTLYHSSSLRVISCGLGGMFLSIDVKIMGWVCCGQFQTTKQALLVSLIGWESDLVRP